MIVYWLSCCVSQLISPALPIVKNNSAGRYFPSIIPSSQGKQQRHGDWQHVLCGKMSEITVVKRPVCGSLFLWNVVNLCCHRAAFSQKTTESLCCRIYLGHADKRT